jgi:hypothetical protein
MIEEWKTIPGYDERYQISNQGRVRKKRYWSGIYLGWKFMTPQLHSHGGYYVIGLALGGKRTYYSIARLVAKAFVANPHNYEYVGHIDGDVTHNYYKNLYWKRSKKYK